MTPLDTSLVPLFGRQCCQQTLAAGAIAQRESGVSQGHVQGLPWREGQRAVM